MSIDPFGLSADDVEAIREHIAVHFPEIRPNGGWEFGIHEPGITGSTVSWSGKIIVDERYAEACLTLEEFTALYFNILHESMHSTDVRSRRLLENTLEFYGVQTRHHESIYNRTGYESLGVATSDNLWGVANRRALRPAIAPMVPDLHETVERPCECQ